MGEKVKSFLLATTLPKDGMINIQSFKQSTSFIPQNQQPFDGYVGGCFILIRIIQEAPLFQNLP